MLAEAPDGPAALARVRLTDSSPSTDPATASWLDSEPVVVEVVAYGQLAVNVTRSITKGTPVEVTDTYRPDSPAGSAVSGDQSRADPSASSRARSRSRCMRAPSSTGRTLRHPVWHSVKRHAHVAVGARHSCPTMGTVAPEGCALAGRRSAGSDPTSARHGARVHTTGPDDPVASRPGAQGRPRPQHRKRRGSTVSRHRRPVPRALVAAGEPGPTEDPYAAAGILIPSVIKTVRHDLQALSSHRRISRMPEVPWPAHWRRGHTSCSSAPPNGCGLLSTSLHGSRGDGDDGPEYGNGQDNRSRGDLRCVFGVPSAPLSRGKISCGCRVGRHADRQIG